ncbi:MAG: hypothetical protein ACRDPW_09765, partial [Mycobacteriales bacterium]
MRLAVGYLGTLTLLAGGLGFWALVTGQPGPAVLLLGGAAYLGLVASLSLRLLGVRGGSAMEIAPGAGRSGERGVRIPYSRWIRRGLATIVALTFAGLVGLALSGLAGWVVPPFRSPPGPITTIVFTTTFACYFLWLLVDMATGRWARGRVVLSPQGIYHRSLTFEHFVPWQAVYAISAEDMGGPLILAKAFPS